MWKCLASDVSLLSLNLSGSFLYDLIVLLCSDIRVLIAREVWPTYTKPQGHLIM